MMTYAFNYGTVVFESIGAQSAAPSWSCASVGYSPPWSSFHISSCLRTVVSCEWAPPARATSDAVVSSWLKEIDALDV